MLAFRRGFALLVNHTFWTGAIVSIAWLLVFFGVIEEGAVSEEDAAAAVVPLVGVIAFVLGTMGVYIPEEPE